jgi:hypothetical protein
MEDKSIIIIGAGFAELSAGIMPNRTPFERKKKEYEQTKSR